MYYKTIHNDSELEYRYHGNRVSIYRNGIHWGSPQGERFVVALLEDIERLQNSLEQAKQDHKRIREMRKWDDYDKLYKKYLKKCAQLEAAKEDEYNPFLPDAIDPNDPFKPRKEI